MLPPCFFLPLPEATSPNEHIFSNERETSKRSDSLFMWFLGTNNFLLNRLSKVYTTRSHLIRSVSSDFGDYMRHFYSDWSFIQNICLHVNTATEMRFVQLPVCHHNMFAYVFLLLFSSGSPVC